MFTTLKSMGVQAYRVCISYLHISALKKAPISVKVIWVAILLSCWFAFVGDDKLMLVLSLLTGVFSLVPFLVSHKHQLYLPKAYLVTIVVFIFASLFLGQAQGFYDTFVWWDTMLHGIAGIIFGLLGFVVLYLYGGSCVAKAKPFKFAILGFIIGMGIAACWESIESILDYFLGTRLQNGGNADTMTDINIYAVGDMIATLAAYLYARGVKKHILKPFSDVISSVDKDEVV